MNQTERARIPATRVIANYCAQLALRTNSGFYLAIRPEVGSYFLVFSTTVGAPSRTIECVSVSQCAGPPIVLTNPSQ